MRIGWSEFRSILLITVLIAPSTAATVEPVDAVWSLEWDLRRSYDVVLQGSTAYVSSEGGLLVVDLSDPTAPREIGSVDLPGSQLTAIAVSNSHAVTVDRASDSVLVIDLADRMAPRVVSRIDGWNGIYDIGIAGDTVLIVDVHGISAVDLSDPSHPARVAGPRMSRAHHLEVVDGIAYLSGFINGLQIADVSRPADPIEIGDSDHAWFRGAGGSHVTGNVAYLVYRNGLMIVDVSDPRSPAEIGFAGDLAAEPGVAGYVKVAGTVACVLGEEGVSFVDVSDPRAPLEVGFLGLPIEPASYLGVWGSRLQLVRSLGAGIEVSGSTAVIAGLTDGLMCVDFSDPQAPRARGRLWESLGRGREAVVAGSRAYVGTTSDFLTISLFDREAPFLTGSINLPGEVHDIEVSGGYAYVTVDWIGLLVIDVRGPTKPRMAGSFPLVVDGMDVAVAGQLACLADGARAFVLDISDPEKPALTAVIDVPAAEAELRGETLAVTTTEFDDAGGEYASLRMFDLSDPRRPKALGTLDFGYRARLGLSGARAYVADVRGLHVVDITDPASPIVVASSYHGSPRAPLAVSDTLVCETVGLQFLWIKILCLTPEPITHCFDVSDPALPLPTGRVYPGVVRAVADGFLYGTTDSSFWVAHAGLLKTRWMSGVAVDPGRTTHLVLLNRWPVENEVAVGLTTPHGAVSGTGVIPARRQLVVELDGASGLEESGMVEVQPTLPILANAQVERTVGPVGNGRIVVGLPEWEKCGCGWFGLDSRAREGPAEGWDSGLGWLVGLRQLEGRFATDLVLSNPDQASDPDLVTPFAGEGPAQDEVEVTLYATDGTELARYTLEVTWGATVVDPEPFARRARRAHLGWGYARIEGRVLASALVHDVRTGDTATVPMVRDPGAQVDDGEVRPQWLDLVAHNDGLLQSCWRTDLVVLNPGGEAARVDLTLHEPGEESSTAITVPGSEQAIFQDVAGLLGSGCKGMLEVGSDRPIVVSGRIYSEAPGGTVGHAVPGWDRYSGLLSGETAWLPGLRQQEGRYRTHINVSNINDEPAHVQVTLFDGYGSQLGEFTVHVPPMRAVQDIEPFVHRGGRPDLGWGYARVTAEQGGGVFVSASVISDVTNDSVTIAMQR